MAGAALLTLVAARHFIGARFTATAIAAGYLAYRAIAWVLLTGTNFPPSLPPFFLLAGALAIDLVFLAFAYTAARSKDPVHTERATTTDSAAADANALTTHAGTGQFVATRVGMALLGAALAVGAVTAAAWVQGLVIGTPPLHWPAFAYGAAALALCWLAIALTARRPTRTPS
jgi:hypothetical protein